MFYDVGIIDKHYEKENVPKNILSFKDILQQDDLYYDIFHQINPLVERIFKKT